MLTSFGQGDKSLRLAFILLVAFLAFVLFFGGASRADAFSQPVVRLAACALLAAVAIQLESEGWRSIRLPALFVGAIGATIAIQLVPLPWSWWAALPGRAPYAEALGAASIPARWRPISLTPDLTLNSLLAVLPPFATILAMGAIPRALHPKLIPVILAGLVVTSLIAVAQISGGVLYFYEVTNAGSGVGIFANRNHQALFLAASFPLIACWAALPHPDKAYRQLRTWIALCLAAAIAPILLITGSRAGLALAVVGIILSAASWLMQGRSGHSGGRSGRGALLILAPLVVGLAGIGSILLLGRGEALDRLFAGSATEVRVQFLPVFAQMARDFFPFGAGFGSFDTIFRSYEPRDALDLSYLNHAHNDFAQIVIEGGILPLVLVAVFLIWFLFRTYKLWRGTGSDPERLAGRAGSIVVLLVILGSAVDYPLRTPFISVLATIACCWMMKWKAPARGDL